MILKTILNFSNNIDIKHPEILFRYLDICANIDNHQINKFSDDLFNTL